MITIIDYGLGNIQAFVNVYDRLNIKTQIAQKPKDLKIATKLILPGIGAFDHAIDRLNKSGLRDELENQVLKNKIPVMGICVGMQLLAKSSEEGSLPGLGWIDGHVKLFDSANIPYKTRFPHMGWNSITPRKNQILSGFNNTSRFYFLHSYYFECYQKENIIATSDYGINFACAVNRDNIFGIQFHPEKSHSNGIRLLSNFANI